MGVGDKFYSKEEVTILREGVPELVTLDVPSDGNVPGLIGQRSYRCVVCGFSYKEQDTVLFRGKPYGKPCGCYKDVYSIMAEERELRRAHRNRR